MEVQTNSILQQPIGIGKKKRIITIAGRPGSGRALAEQLGYEHFSSGDLLRSIGKERSHDVPRANLDAE